nr:MAG TPA: hypothetical protein [Caudoviricetes sp.]
MRPLWHTRAKRNLQKGMQCAPRLLRTGRRRS